MIWTVTTDKLFLKVVEANYDELEQIKLSFKKKTSNYFFHPLYKKKLWDGTINFFDRNQQISVGLWNELKSVCKDNDIECKIKGLKQIVNINFDEVDFDGWVEVFFKDSELKPRDYQIESAKKILKLNRSISEIATSAGKTLIIYIVFSYLLSQDDRRKFVVIVPNISLIEQTAEKFEQYSDGKDVEYKIQYILSGESKKLKSDTNLVIGTYQSLVKLDKTFFDTVYGLCVDESHFTAASSIQKIIKNMPNVHFRFGLSGTTKVKNYNNAEAYTIQAALGPLGNSITNDFLSSGGYTTKLKINIIELDYLEESNRLKLKNLKSDPNMDSRKLFSLEKEIVTSHPKRFEFLMSLLTKVTKNSLILFSDVSGGYGHKITEFLKDKMSTDFQIFYIDGSVSKELREYYRKEAIRTDIVTILVASFGVFSTGIDIPNIFNIFLTESYKSEVIIKQSLGRGMRLLKGKDFVNIFDLVDDFRLGKYTNYLYKHSLDRQEIYKNEKFDCKIKKIKF